MILRRGPQGPLARRYTAGEQLHEALQVVKALKEKEIDSTVEFLPDNLVSGNDIDGVMAQYVEILKGVGTFYPDAWVSVRLSALGLAANPALAKANLVKLLDDAAARGAIFISLAMDKAVRVSETIGIVKDLHEKYPNLGLTLQSNLRRTERDITDVAAMGISVRLVKGSYDEPSTAAFIKPDEIKAAYRRQMFELLDSGIHHSLATHDLDLINSAKLYAKQKGISKGNYDFEMYKGVRPDLQVSLAKEGYGVRVFVPYGMSWYPYVIARLNENPGGVAFLLGNLLG